MNEKFFGGIGYIVSGVSIVVFGCCLGYMKAMEVKEYTIPCTIYILVSGILVLVGLLIFIPMGIEEIKKSKKIGN